MKILQIMPADNWFAVYEGDYEDITLLHPLVCWVLVECDDGTTIVTGMETDEEGGAILLIPHSEKFVRYHCAPLLHEGEPS